MNMGEGESAIRTFPLLAQMGGRDGEGEGYRPYLQIGHKNKIKTLTLFCCFFYLFFFPQKKIPDY